VPAASRSKFEFEDGNPRVSPSLCEHPSRASLVFMSCTHIDRPVQSTATSGNSVCCKPPLQTHLVTLRGGHIPMTEVVLECWHATLEGHLSASNASALVAA